MYNIGIFIVVVISPGCITEQDMRAPTVYVAMAA